jgi:hypothetical protein
MINPGGILTPDGVHYLNWRLFDELYYDQAQGLWKGGQKFQSAGARFHQRFQDLDKQGVYHAPEAQTLFNSTIPVDTHSHDFGSGIRQVGEALSDYATAAKGKVQALEGVKAEAEQFLRDVADTGEEWKNSEDLVRQHNAMVDRVGTLHRQLVSDQIYAHDRIQALIGGTQIVAGSPGSQDWQLNLVAKAGADAVAAGDGGKAPPWGTPEALPSNINKLIWESYSGFRELGLPAPANQFLRGFYPVMNALLEGLAFPFTFGYHWGATTAAGVGDNLTVAVDSFLKVPTEVGLGILQTVVGVGLAVPAAGILPTLTGKDVADAALSAVSKEGELQGLKSFIGDSHQAGEKFLGFDRFAKGDIAGGIGALIAGPGLLLAGPKVPKVLAMRGVSPGLTAVVDVGLNGFPLAKAAGDAGFGRITAPLEEARRLEIDTGRAREAAEIRAARNAEEAGIAAERAVEGGGVNLIRGAESARIAAEEAAEHAAREADTAQIAAERQKIRAAEQTRQAAERSALEQPFQQREEAIAEGLRRGDEFRQATRGADTPEARAENEATRAAEAEQRAAQHQKDLERLSDRHKREDARTEARFAEFDSNRAKAEAEAEKARTAKTEALAERHRAGDADRANHQQAQDDARERARNAEDEARDERHRAEDRDRVPLNELPRSVREVLGVLDGLAPGVLGDIGDGAVERAGERHFQAIVRTLRSGEPIDRKDIDFLRELGFSEPDLDALAKDLGLPGAD